MAQEYAQSTIDKMRALLEEEEARLTALIAEKEREREEAQLSASAAEHNPDPENMEGGSMAFEMEKDLSLQQNAEHMLAQVRDAKKRIEDGTYGLCEECGKRIPLARLEVLPHTPVCVDCARKR